MNFREDFWPPRTNPRWTPLFARAAAVVTDTGSRMAHASPVAREYGIPAVVETGDRTMRLRDGMVVGPWTGRAEWLRRGARAVGTGAMSWSL